MHNIAKDHPSFFVFTLIGQGTDHRGMRFVEYKYREIHKNGKLAYCTMITQPQKNAKTSLKSDIPAERRSCAVRRERRRELYRNNSPQETEIVSL